MNGQNSIGKRILKFRNLNHFGSLLKKIAFKIRLVIYGRLKIATNKCIDVIAYNLIKKNHTDYQYFSIMHFVLFIASMTFTFFYYSYYLN